MVAMALSWLLGCYLLAEVSAIFWSLNIKLLRWSK